ncbi:MAG: YihY/virulence factor BrkB family protein [Ignavibacteriaceae bacterium]|nr:YihY/virulence factor BrkB family protein [Ignavibacteriaceae bacterium]
MLNLKHKEKFLFLKFQTLTDAVNSFLQFRPSYKKFKVFFKHYIIGLSNRMDEHHVFLLAGGLAFSLFVCIIPFFLIMFSILGNILNSHNIQTQVNVAIDTIIPYDNYSEFVKKIIFTRINEVIEYKNIAGIIGGFGLLFAASGLFSSMRTILNKVFGVEANVHFLLGKLRDFALVIMVILIFFITTIMSPILDLIIQAAQGWESLSFFKSPIFAHFMLSIISLALIFVVFIILYITVPVRKFGKNSAFMSAVWAALLWEAAKQGFGFYLHHFATFGKIYGAYAFVVVVAFWIYYSSIVFIIGAEIGRLYIERKKMLAEQSLNLF